MAKKMGLSVSMEVRPCVVGGDRRAMLHCFGYRAWTHGAGLTIDSFPSGQECEPVAVVEFGDGRIGVVPAESVRLLDSADLFAGYAWGGES